MARLFDAIASWDASPFASFPGAAWDVVAELQGIVRELFDGLGDAYGIEGDIALYQSAEIEGGAALQSPLIIGSNCRIANEALLRGGCWLGEDPPTPSGAFARSVSGATVEAARRPRGREVSDGGVRPALRPVESVRLDAGEPGGFEDRRHLGPIVRLPQRRRRLSRERGPRSH